MPTRKVMRQFIRMLDNMEKHFFKDTDLPKIYGKYYSRKDWHEYTEVIRIAMKDKKRLSKNSAKYLDKNKEYNRLMRRLSYYKNKENKTENDFIKIEELKKEVDNYIKQKQIKKEEKKLRDLKKEQDALINLIKNEDRGE